MAHYGTSLTWQRQSQQDRVDQVCESWLADPAKGEARHRDTELGGGDVRVEVVERIENAVGVGVALSRELLNTCPADADESKLGGYEEAVGGDEEDDR